MFLNSDLKSLILGYKNKEIFGFNNNIDLFVHNLELNYRLQKNLVPRNEKVKKLSKAKFWVKIMDANNMEFDSKELTFNDFDSISSLFRHLVLKDGHTTNKNIIEKMTHDKKLEIGVAFKKDDILLEDLCFVLDY